MKCDEIFDLLVKYGQIIVPPGAKIPPLEQRKKGGFCKYHHFLDHNTSQCFLFRDLVQNAINDRRLKFKDMGKANMKIDFDPLQMADAYYTEHVNVHMIEATEHLGKKSAMVEATKGFKHEVEMTKAIEGLIVKLQKVGITDWVNLEINMVEVSEKDDMETNEESIRRTEDHMRVVYPKNDENSIELLHHCQKNKSEVMLCPKCSYVFDKKVAEILERVRIACYKGN